MKSRIKFLLDKEKVTSAQFASEIGIAASSLHHIISGRNNPSLEVIQKILDRFPQINAEWLINGKGNTFKPLVQGQLFDIPAIEPKKEENIDDFPLVNASKEPEISSDKHLDINSLVNNQELPKVENSKIISKIILLYEDGTFDIHLKN